MPHFNRRQRRVLRLIVVNLILLCLALAWSNREQSVAVEVAVAKGKQMLDMNLFAAPALDAAVAQRIALESQPLDEIAGSSDLEFVSAARLSPGEARYWQDEGCRGSNCAHVTFYNHEHGGTSEAIVNLETAAVAARWDNPAARPAGSTHVLARAVAIAAESSQVSAILGDIGAADPAMVPMSGWLMDDACRDEWCVDLSFHDPNGTGRIFHVFVNMEREKVARTFYTRARADRSAAKPVAQRDAYSDGCHEQYGWEVCWEMTAHDGVNFIDATYNGQLIFSTAKIGQVEAWYPSWPGGYRDEIGFSASVPPFGDTILDDLGDAFEVRQLFTEFTRWPNCICCYRYEEIVRFYANGQLDFSFVSHGPGCDDLSVYRPFWRIDLDLDGPDADQVWLWDALSWDETLEEFEEHPLVDDVSPSGYNLATFDDDLHYRWFMEPTDPLGVDEGYLFLLQFKENEGNGPIVTGPGDTYIPPRQWIDGDALSGENIVLWHVPLLKTKKGGPYWCMPDPDPAFSPCDAILRAIPSEPLTPAEIAGTPVVLPTVETPPVATAVPTPTAEATPAPTATPRPITGTDAEEIILNAGCGSCHQIGDIGEAHKVGPDLSDIGQIAAERIAGMSAEAYIRESILDPNAFLAPECPNSACLPNIMPRDYGQRLTPEQVDTIVAFLLHQQQVADTMSTPSLENEAAEPAPKAFPAPKNARRAPALQGPTATQAVQILLLSLVFLLSLLVYFRGTPKE